MERQNENENSQQNNSSVETLNQQMLRYGFSSFDDLFYEFDVRDDYPSWMYVLLYIIGKYASSNINDRFTTCVVLSNIKHIYSPDEVAKYVKYSYIIELVANFIDNNNSSAFFLRSNKLSMQSLILLQIHHGKFKKFKVYFSFEGEFFNVSRGDNKNYSYDGDLSDETISLLDTNGVLVDNSYVYFNISEKPIGPDLFFLNEKTEVIEIPLFTVFDMGEEDLQIFSTNHVCASEDDLIIPSYNTAIELYNGLGENNIQSLVNSENNPFSILVIQIVLLLGDPDNKIENLKIMVEHFTSKHGIVIPFKNIELSEYIYNLFICSQRIFIIREIDSNEIDEFIFTQWAIYIKHPTLITRIINKEEEKLSLEYEYRVIQKSFLPLDKLSHSISKHYGECLTHGTSFFYKDNNNNYLFIEKEEEGIYDLFEFKENVQFVSGSQSISSNYIEVEENEELVLNVDRYTFDHKRNKISNTCRTKEIQKINNSEFIALNSISKTYIPNEIFYKNIQDKIIIPNCEKMIIDALNSQVKEVNNEMLSKVEAEINEGLVQRKAYVPDYVFTYTPYEKSEVEIPQVESGAYRKETIVEVEDQVEEMKYFDEIIKSKFVSISANVETEYKKSVNIDKKDRKDYLVIEWRDFIKGKYILDNDGRGIFPNINAKLTIEFFDNKPIFKNRLSIYLQSNIDMGEFMFHVTILYVPKEYDGYIDIFSDKDYLTTSEDPNGQWLNRLFTISSVSSSLLPVPSYYKQYHVTWIRNENISKLYKIIKLDNSEMLCGITQSLGLISESKYGIEEVENNILNRFPDNSNNMIIPLTEIINQSILEESILDLKTSEESFSTMDISRNLFINRIHNEIEKRIREKLEKDEYKVNDYSYIDNFLNIRKKGYSYAPDIIAYKNDNIYLVEVTTSIRRSIICEKITKYKAMLEKIGKIYKDNKGKFYSKDSFNFKFSLVNGWKVINIIFCIVYDNFILKELGVLKPQYSDLVYHQLDKVINIPVSIKYFPVKRKLYDINIDAELDGVKVANENNKSILKTYLTFVHNIPIKFHSISKKAKNSFKGIFTPSILKAIDNKDGEEISKELSKNFLNIFFSSKERHAIEDESVGYTSNLAILHESIISSLQETGIIYPMYEYEKNTKNIKYDINSQIDTIFRKIISESKTIYEKYKGIFTIIMDNIKLFKIVLQLNNLNIAKPVKKIIKNKKIDKSLRSVDQVSISNRYMLSFDIRKGIKVIGVPTKSPSGSPFFIIVNNTNSNLTKIMTNFFNHYEYKGYILIGPLRYPSSMAASMLDFLFSFIKHPILYDLNSNNPMESEELLNMMIFMTRSRYISTLLGAYKEIKNASDSRSTNLFITLSDSIPRPPITLMESMFTRMIYDAVFRLSYQRSVNSIIENYIQEKYGYVDKNSIIAFLRQEIVKRGVFQWNKNISYRISHYFSEKLIKKLSRYEKAMYETKFGLLPSFFDEEHFTNNKENYILFNRDEINAYSKNLKIPIHYMWMFEVPLTYKPPFGYIYHSTFPKNPLEEGYEVKYFPKNLTTNEFGEYRVFENLIDLAVKVEFVSMVKSKYLYYDFDYIVYAASTIDKIIGIEKKLNIDFNLFMGDPALRFKRINNISNFNICSLIHKTLTYNEYAIMTPASSMNKIIQLTRNKIFFFLVRHKNESIKYREFCIPQPIFVVMSKLLNTICLNVARKLRFEKMHDTDYNKFQFLSDELSRDPGATCLSWDITKMGPSFMLDILILFVSNSNLFGEYRNFILHCLNSLRNTYFKIPESHIASIFGRNFFNILRGYKNISSVSELENIFKRETGLDFKKVYYLDNLEYGRWINDYNEGKFPEENQKRIHLRYLQLVNYNISPFFIYIKTNYIQGSINLLISIYHSIALEMFEHDYKYGIKCAITNDDGVMIIPSHGINKGFTYEKFVVHLSKFNLKINRKKVKQTKGLLEMNQILISSEGENHMLFKQLSYGLGCGLPNYLSLSNTFKSTSINYVKQGGSEFISELCRILTHIIYTRVSGIQKYFHDNKDTSSCSIFNIPEELGGIPLFLPSFNVITTDYNRDRLILLYEQGLNIPGLSSILKDPLKHQATRLNFIYQTPSSMELKRIRKYIFSQTASNFRTEDYQKNIFYHLFSPNDKFMKDHLKYIINSSKSKEIFKSSNQYSHVYQLLNKVWRIRVKTPDLFSLNESKLQINKYISLKEALDIFLKQNRLKIANHFIIRANQTYSILGPLKIKLSYNTPKDYVKTVKSSRKKLLANSIESIVLYLSDRNNYNRGLCPLSNPLLLNNDLYLINNTPVIKEKMELLKVSNFEKFISTATLEDIDSISAIVHLLNNLYGVKYVYSTKKLYSNSDFIENMGNIYGGVIICKHFEYVNDEGRKIQQLNESSCIKKIKAMETYKKRYPKLTFFLDSYINSVLLKHELYQLSEMIKNSNLIATNRVLCSNVTESYSVVSTSNSILSQDWGKSKMTSILFYRINTLIGYIQIQDHKMRMEIKGEFTIKDPILLYLLIDRELSVFNKRWFLLTENVNFDDPSIKVFETNGIVTGATLAVGSIDRLPIYIKDKIDVLNVNKNIPLEFNSFSQGSIKPRCTEDIQVNIINNEIEKMSTTVNLYKDIYAKLAPKRDIPDPIIYYLFDTNTISVFSYPISVFLTENTSTSITLGNSIIINNRPIEIGSALLNLTVYGGYNPNEGTNTCDQQEENENKFLNNISYALKYKYLMLDEGNLSNFLTLNYTRYKPYYLDIGILDHLNHWGIIVRIILIYLDVIFFPRERYSLTEEQISEISKYFYLMYFACFGMHPSFDELILMISFKVSLFKDIKPTQENIDRVKSIILPFVPIDFIDINSVEEENSSKFTLSSSSTNAFKSILYINRSNLEIATYPYEPIPRHLVSITLFLKGYKIEKSYFNLINDMNKNIVDMIENHNTYYSSNGINILSILPYEWILFISFQYKREFYANIARTSIVKSNIKNKKYDGKPFDEIYYNEIIDNHNFGVLFSNKGLLKKDYDWFNYIFPYVITKKLLYIFPNIFDAEKNVNELISKHSKGKHRWIQKEIYIGSNVILMPLEKNENLELNINKNIKTNKGNLVIVPLNFLSTITIMTEEISQERKESLLLNLKIQSYNVRSCFNNMLSGYLAIGDKLNSDSEVGCYFKDIFGIFFSVSFRFPTINDYYEIIKNKEILNTYGKEIDEFKKLPENKKLYKYVNESIKIQINNAIKTKVAKNVWKKIIDPNFKMIFKERIRIPISHIDRSKSLKKGTIKCNRKDGYISLKTNEIPHLKDFIMSYNSCKNIYAELLSMKKDMVVEINMKESNFTDDYQDKSMIDIINSDLLLIRRNIYDKILSDDKYEKIKSLKWQNEEENEEEEI